MVAYERVEHEISLGRIAGSFRFRPIPNWRSSPMGLVPKKSSRWNLLTHLSYPSSFIDENLTTVQYSKFDNVISIIQALGEHVKIGKNHIKSVFRLLLCYPGDFDLLGLKIGDMYYIDKCMPM